MAPFPAEKLALLERLIANGDFEGVGAATAKRRWPSDFGSIPTKTLNNKIRYVRQKIGTGRSKQDSEPSVALNRMGGPFRAGSSKEPVDIDEGSDSMGEMEEGSDVQEGGDGAGDQSLPMTMFMPNYLYGPWRNPEDDDNAWCSVIIWLASGVGSDDEFKLAVSDCGMFLEFSLYWPKCFLNTVDVHEMWLNGVGGTPRLESYHPMIKCFRKFINSMQGLTGEKVYQTARIPLRFQVESRFEVYPQQWANGLQMLYVMMRAPARNIKRASTRIKFVQLTASEPSDCKVAATASTSEVTVSK